MLRNPARLLVNVNDDGPSNLIRRISCSGNSLALTSASSGQPSDAVRSTPRQYTRGYGIHRKPASRDILESTLANIERRVHQTLLRNRASRFSVPYVQRISSIKTGNVYVGEARNAHINSPKRAHPSPVTGAKWPVLVSTRDGGIYTPDRTLGRAFNIATAASYAAVIVGKGFPSAWTGAPTRSLTGWPESLRGRSEFSVGIRLARACISGIYPKHDDEGESEYSLKRIG
ncbi:hypothetical protein PCH_Pc21g19840 [Penicillium rubens Wisconsin 54-1255]|uniref:Uncharacterized protein n=1 Tax=Penicillium rubens (strain ATCC 28089 / DSM 1075 / NRRL 1951 / Wisconsin 54-1255) TaxID=500485 RepID=B6HJY2_PENRW|nr:hypothetical protein PCH_Pc21g19840 [Penicillium rubens Wisconsin 54-1255]